MGLLLQTFLSFIYKKLSIYFFVLFFIIFAYNYKYFFMKIEISENGSLILKEIYSPIGIKTNDGETLILMMRDSGFEVCYENNWFSLQKGKIKSQQEIRKEVKTKWYNEPEEPETCLFDF